MLCFRFQRIPAAVAAGPQFLLQSPRAAHRGAHLQLRRRCAGGALVLLVGAVHADVQRGAGAARAHTGTR